MPKPSPTGSTFAERAAAAAGKESFVAPNPDPQAPAENSTFAERAGKGKKAVSDDGAENKAVAKKSAAKKS